MSTANAPLEVPYTQPVPAYPTIDELASQQLSLQNAMKSIPQRPPPPPFFTPTAPDAAGAGISPRSRKSGPNGSPTPRIRKPRDRDVTLVLEEAVEALTHRKHIEKAQQQEYEAVRQGSLGAYQSELRKFLEARDRDQTALAASPGEKMRKRRRTVSNSQAPDYQPLTSILPPATASPSQVKPSESGPAVWYSGLMSNASISRLAWPQTASTSTFYSPALQMNPGASAAATANDLDSLVRVTTTPPPTSRTKEGSRGRLRERGPRDQSPTVSVASLESSSSKGNKNGLDLLAFAAGFPPEDEEMPQEPPPKAKRGGSKSASKRKVAAKQVAPPPAVTPTRGTRRSSRLKPTDGVHATEPEDNDRSESTSKAQHASLPPSSTPKRRSKRLRGRSEEDVIEEEESSSGKGDALQPLLGDALPQTLLEQLEVPRTASKVQRSTKAQAPGEGDSKKSAPSKRGPGRPKGTRSSTSAKGKGPTVDNEVVADDETNAVDDMVVEDADAAGNGA